MTVTVTPLDVARARDAVKHSPRADMPAELRDRAIDLANELLEAHGDQALILDILRPLHERADFGYQVAAVLLVLLVESIEPIPTSTTNTKENR